MSRYGNNEKYNSIRDDYMTPEDIYKPMLEIFGKQRFDIDVCCTVPNIPANINYTKNENGLLQNWSGLCFCNPPWKPTAKWLKKGVIEVQKTLNAIKPACEVVYVIPSNRLETLYMQEHIINNPNCVWMVLPGKRGFIIPGHENEQLIPSVGVMVAILTNRPAWVLEQLNTIKPFNTTAFCKL